MNPTSQAIIEQIKQRTALEKIAELDALLASIDKAHAAIDMQRVAVAYSGENAESSRIVFRVH